MALKYTKMERNWVMYDVGNSALDVYKRQVVYFCTRFARETEPND